MNKTYIILTVGVVLAIVLIVALVGTTPREARQPQPAVSPGVQQSSLLRKTDDKGDTWALELAGGQPFAAGSTAVQAGPPIVVRTDAYRVNERETSIGLVLQGQAGETYRPGITRNGTRLSAPAFRIVNEAGQVVAQGNFNYG